ncbi:spermatogenesis associated 6-like protein [Diretmus argenteus]
MSRKALKLVVEVKFSAVSCPGVHLAAKDDIYLSMCFMGQYRKSDCLPAIFPLLVYEKMTFEKIFRHAVDPGDIAIMLEYETVRVEVVQLIPPVGEALACFEEDARHFLFPEPKLVPSFSGVGREVLMTRAPHFPGIAPRLEFSTKTTISECSADAETNIHPNVPMASDEEAGEAVQQAEDVLSSEKKIPDPREETRQQDGQRSTRRPIGDSQIAFPFAAVPGPAQPGLRDPQPGKLGHSRHLPACKSRSSSHSLWEEVHERVRGLLTTPKAVRRLVSGATDSEVDDVLARRSISPGPP